MSDFDTSPRTPDPAGEAHVTRATRPAAPTPVPPLTETLSDPLLRAPRRASTILTIIFGVISLLAAAGVWWLADHTVTGQRYDDLVWQTLRDGLPAWSGPIVSFFTKSTFVIGIIILIGIVSVIIVLIRRRWRLLVQIAAFALLSFAFGYTLKRVLPRPVLDPALANPANTSPSGHTVATFAACVVFLMAVPLALRFLAALLGVLFSTSVAVSLISDQWHRPSDTLVAFLMVAGLAFLTLAFTRGSGMDKIGARRSSATLQIVSTVMIVAGGFAVAFAAYLAWQVAPGLEMMAAWTVAAAQGSSILAIAGTSSLLLGTLLAMRQVTASPLSAVGLVGAPPAPPVHEV